MAKIKHPCSICKGETLETYLKCKGLDPDARYAHSSYACLDEDGWHSQGDMCWFGLSSNDMEESSWNEKMQAFIASIPDDDFLVAEDNQVSADVGSEQQQDAAFAAGYLQAVGELNDFLRIQAKQNSERSHEAF